MATVGNSTTPTGVNFFSKGATVGDQVATQYTMPSPGGFLTTLHCYAATFTGTITPTLCLWDVSGNLLASVAATSTISAGAPAWVSGTLAGSGQFIASGAVFYIGWATSSADGFYATYNTGGSGIWNEQASPPGSMGSNTSWVGTLGAYADYTPGGAAWVNTGTAGSPNWVQGVVYVNTGTSGSPVWTPCNGIFVNTGTSGSPVWTPGA